MSMELPFLYYCYPSDSLSLSLSLSFCISEFIFFDALRRCNAYVMVSGTH